MKLSVGILSAAHVHTPSYARCLNANPHAELVGIWDDNAERGSKFATDYGTEFFDSVDHLLERVDAVVISSENVKHVELACRAGEMRKSVLCEKPLATTESDARQMIEAVRAGGGILMTAFPCPFSPAFERLVARLQSGEMGNIRAIAATNRGTCPFGWFVDPSLSGGGAMIDHVVHVADLFKRMLGATPTSVQATTGHNMYSETWEDTAMLTLTYESGVFATLDSSWSRPKGYKTWGDVTLNVVCDNGVLEADLFGQCFDAFGANAPTHRMGGFGSDLDSRMVGEFVDAVLNKREPKVTGEDGLDALMVALRGYASVQSSQPVTA